MDEDEEQQYVAITVGELDSLMIDASFCQALYMAGVEDWRGYELAEEIFEDLMSEHGQILH